MSEMFKEMMDQLTDFRYGLTVISSLVLGLLLLFFNDLPENIQHYLIPSLAIFTVGTGLIAKIQLLLTASENTKRWADNKKPRGIKEGHLCWIIVSYIVWFVGLVVYNFLKATI